MTAAPDVIGEVFGWRAWQIIGDADLCRLESASHSASGNGADGIWPAGRWFEARCLTNRAHNEPGAGIPVESCSCGIYAAKTLEQLVGLPYWKFQDDGENVPCKVVGEVAFSGKVIEGMQGWRAERARVSRLWVPHRSWEFVEPLSEAYGVPVGFARMVPVAGGGIELDEGTDEPV